MVWSNVVIALAISNDFAIDDIFLSAYAHLAILSQRFCRTMSQRLYRMLTTYVFECDGSHITILSHDKISYRIVS